MNIDINTLSEDEKKILRSELRGTSKYKRKGVYRQKEISTRYFDPPMWENFYFKLSPNLRFYFQFLLLTGMRYKEAKHVKVRNIDFSNRHVIITNPKGGKIMRYSQLSTYTIKKIRVYIKENNLKLDNTFNFPSIQHLGQTMKKICRELKIDGWRDYSIHNLRKTHENYLDSLDLDPARVARHMGHTQKTAQEHYLSSAFIKDKKQLDLIRLWLGDIFG